MHKTRVPTAARQHQLEKEAVLLISDDELAELMPMERAIGLFRRSLGLTAATSSPPPQRIVLDLGQPNALGVMAAASRDRGEAVVKIVGFFPEEARHGAKASPGMLVLLDAATGTPQAILNSAPVTATRTAAASGLATDLLARAGASRLAIVGYGAQARSHLAAMMAVRPIRTVAIGGRQASRAEELAKWARGRWPATQFSWTDNIKECVAEADIVCTTTAAPSPFLAAEWPPPGCHINAIGGAVPGGYELLEAVFENAFVVVDSAAAMLEAPEFVSFMQSKGAVPTLAELAAGTARKPHGAARTIYRSVGSALFDLIVASHCRAEAVRRGLGRRISFG